MNKKIFVLSDIHIPYQDVQFIKTILHDIRKEKPSQIVLIGDIIDFYPLSRFRKDPSKILTLNKELEDCELFISRLRKAANDAAIIYCEGNHEIRLRKFLWDNAPQLTTIFTDIQSFLGLNRYGVKYYNSKEIFTSGIYNFMHGVYLRKNPGASVLEHINRLGKNIVIGHCHRLAIVQVSIGQKQILGIEAGCLTRPEYHDYIQSPDPNWCFGYVVIPDVNRPVVELRQL
jgi:predicted phosphodiesterase